MSLYYMPMVEEKIEVTDSGSTTLNASIQLGAGIIVDFGQALINSYDEYNTHFLTNLGVSQEILVNSKAKKEKFIEYLGNLEASDSKLIIIDPYFFKGGKKYQTFIVEVLTTSKAKEIIVITNMDNDHFNLKTYEEVDEIFNGKLTVKEFGGFHDRFWITDHNSGFTIGTSLNGLNNNKVTRINKLCDNEIKTIMDKLHENGLLE